MSLHSGNVQGDGLVRTDDDTLSHWLRRLLIVGMVVLVLGMAVMPAGASYNPGKLYQRLLALTLYLPALLLLVRRPRRWLEFWRQPLMPWVVLLLTWGSVTLLWSNSTHLLSELGRNLSILLFLFGWLQAFSNHEDRIRQLLVGCACGLVPVALAAMFMQLFYPDPEAGGRLAGFGVMDNANLAAAAMGVAILWLSTWPFREFKHRILQAIALCVLGLFVLLTFTRSAWGALFIALLVFALCQGGRRVWRYVGWLILFGVIGACIGLPELTKRGWSLRPEIMAQSWSLFSKHPWLGLGQGTEFQIDVGADTLTHAHNLFSQVAIELGLPGLVLWVGIWLALGWRGWCYRRERLGRLVLMTWVFATIMVQFDLPHLLDSPRPDWLIIWLPLALSFSFGKHVSVANKDA
ncbi:MAG: O-antigen ligase family protein [Rhodanobacter sp.]